MLAFETIPCAQEARVISTLLREEFPNVYAWISFSCKVLIGRNSMHKVTVRAILIVISRIGWSKHLRRVIIKGVCR